MASADDSWPPKVGLNVSNRAYANHTQDDPMPRTLLEIIRAIDPCSTSELSRPNSPTTFIILYSSLVVSSNQHLFLDLWDHKMTKESCALGDLDAVCTRGLRIPDELCFKSVASQVHQVYHHSRMRLRPNKPHKPKSFKPYL